MLTEDEYDEEEKYLAKLGMTPDQAVWRRGKIAESSLDAFHEEFPSTFEESCIVTGSSVFDNSRVIRIQQAITEKKVKPLSLDKIVGLPQILRPYVQNKSLLIWDVPKYGVKYYAGIDVSEGLGGKHDYSTIFMVDADGKQVLEFRNNKIKPYIFADVCDAVGRWYNKALLTVEKASGGHSVIERLRYEKHYMNMLNDIACIPSVLGSSTSIANISEVAMKILFAMAEVNANECKKWLNTGFKQRFKTFQKILNMQGISVGCDVDVVYNVAMPVAGSEMIANLKALQEMGAVSVDTIMEKVDLVSDPEVEKVRLQNEKSVVNPSDTVGIE